MTRLVELRCHNCGATLNEKLECEYCGAAYMADKDNNAEPELMLDGVMGPLTRKAFASRVRCDVVVEGE